MIASCLDGQVDAWSRILGLPISLKLLLFFLFIWRGIDLAIAHWADASEEQISSSCSYPAWTPPSHHLKPAAAGAEQNFRLYTKLRDLWDISGWPTPTKFIPTWFQPHLMLIPPGNISISPATLQGWPGVGSPGEGDLLAGFRVNSGGPIIQPRFVGVSSLCPDIKVHYWKQINFCCCCWNILFLH